MNVWNLGYVSSDKEESNDTDYEDYYKIAGLKHSE